MVQGRLANLVEKRAQAWLTDGRIFQMPSSTLFSRRESRGLGASNDAGTVKYHLTEQGKDVLVAAI